MAFSSFFFSFVCFLEDSFMSFLFFRKDLFGVCLLVFVYFAATGLFFFGYVFSGFVVLFVYFALLDSVYRHF